MCICQIITTSGIKKNYFRKVVNDQIPPSFYSNVPENVNVRFGSESLGVGSRKGSEKVKNFFMAKELVLECQPWGKITLESWPQHFI